MWDVDYQHTTTANFSNESRKAVVDASGNVFVLADVTSDIDPFGVVTASTWHYTVLLKFSSTGTLLDSEQIFVFNHNTVGFDNYGAFGLDLDATGNVYVGFTTFSLSNGFNANIVKYDNNLTQIWYYQFKPPSQDLGVDMKVSSTGNVYALVKSASGTDTTFHILYANSSVVTTIPFYSFDTNADFLTKLTLDGSQDIYVTGYKLTAGFKAILTAKVSTAGNLVWKRTYNGGSSTRDDQGRNLTIGADGNLYVTGVSDLGPPLNNDIILMKHAVSNGKSLWVKLYDYNNNNDQGHFVIAPDINNVYVGSVSSNTVLIDRVQTFSGNNSGRAVYQPVPVEPHSSLSGVSLIDFKISPNLNFYITGNVLATDLSGQTFSAVYLARFIMNVNSRNIFRLDFEHPVSGDFNQSFKASSLALDNLNEDVYWLGDLNENYSNHQNEAALLFNFDVPSPFKASLNQQLIYDNENGNIINVSGDKSSLNIISVSEITTVELLDMSGRKIKTDSVKAFNIIVNTTSLLPGTYMLVLTHIDGSVSCKKIFIK